MGSGIAVRRDITVVVLRRQARLQKDGRVAARLLALANVLDGMDRDSAARAAGMTRQTLRDWVHRYNEQGMAGLSNQPKGHTRRRLAAAQEAELEALVLQGPDPDSGLVRWRRIDLQARIEAQFGVTYHERTIGKILRRLGFVRISVRPQHPKTDLAVQEAFKKTL